MGEAPAIGIDLGTTYSCVAVNQDGNIEIITNDQGNRTTPSYVAFNEIERLLGDTAKEQVVVNPENTIFDSKRLIGRRFDDETVQADMKHWPFTVINDGGKPKIQVQYRGETKTFYPQEISSMVLTKMKDIAQDYLGNTVTKAVITVPVQFNNSQRQATIDAGTIAGLKVLNILNEPTAAAIAFGLDKKGHGKRYVLIFDFGGGTFDVSILTIENSKIEVIATGGDTHLGGEDIDNRMVDHFKLEFLRKHRLDISDNKRALRRLRTRCEKAKCRLSSVMQASIEVDSLVEAIDFRSNITRAKFEEMNDDLFSSTMKHVESALRDAKLNKSDIDDIVLVGGSTRIPKVQKLLLEFFDGKKLNKSVNPEEAVAYGAAVQAAILDDNISEEMQDLAIVQVTSMSLGTEIAGGLMSVIIERNTPIPCKKTELYVTVKDKQTAMGIQVYEGERPMVKDNHFLGKYRLTGIPPAPPGVAKIHDTMEIDINGILKVSSVVKSTGKTKNITIFMDNDRLSKEEIARMINDAEKYKDEDEEQKLTIQSKNDLEFYCAKVKSILDDEKLNYKISEADKTTIMDKLEVVSRWLDTSQLAKKKDFEDQRIKLESECKHIIGDL